MSRSHDSKLNPVLAALWILAVAMIQPASMAASDATQTRWIVELETKPFAQIDHTSLRPHRALATPDGERAMAHIVASQSNLLSDIQRRLERPVDVVRSYQMATVGFAIDMSDAEAQRIKQLPGVLRVTRDELLSLSQAHTRMQVNADAALDTPLIGDPVVDLIGAAAVWDGSATGDAGHQGEGVVVGVMGTGINGDHPAFADLAQDGYQHINPYGDGTFVGECFDTPQITCNNKLIGRWSFVGGVTSEDDDGYTTFVTGLAAGNRLSDDDGIDGFGVNVVTGIAPRANVIAYRVCAPSCAGSAVLAAFDQAISDGVDVLVHIAGSPSRSPWEDVLALAALSANSAGVSLSYTVGASGPGPGSIALSLAAPWVASFTTTTHGADVAARSLQALSGGNTPAPALLSGRSLTQTVTAPIVDAANYPNPNAPGTNPAQCLQPFPLGTFDGQIVVCERGEISRLQKSINVADGGAGGLVLANTPDGLESLGSDFYAVPGIHINAADGEQLRAWLASGTDHVASILFASSESDPSQADLVAAFNSRGPNLGLSYLAPMLAAPSLDVAGPWIAPQNFRLTGARGSAPGAGALALVKSAHPDWTPAQLLSALVTTATAPLREIDAVTPTGPLDHGGGRIDVARAVNAGLVLDVNETQFLAANPATGGRPAALNLAGLIELACVADCGWTRTVRATRNGTWTTSGDIDTPLLDVDVSPSTFTLAAGQSQILQINVSATGDVPDAMFTGNVHVTPQDGATATSTLPLAVRWLNDDDLDGVADASDNCVNIANADQRDTNGDGFGNVCDADLDNNCLVNILDLGIFRDQFGQTGELDADLDGNLTVDTADLARMRALFFTAPGPSSLTACSNDASERMESSL